MIHPQGNIAQFSTSIRTLPFFSRLSFLFVTGMPPMEITQLARKTRNEFAIESQCIQSDIDRYHQVLKSSLATCPIIQLGKIDFIDLIFVHRTIKWIYLIPIKIRASLIFVHLACAKKGANSHSMKV